jgi:hypothetical protein
MPAEMRCPIRYHDSYAVARVEGVLDLAGAVAIRSALLKCLAQCPEAVLVDLSRMRLGNPAALSVFLVVARQAARWPAAPVVLCAARPDAASLLRARAIERRCLLAPSLAAATRSLRSGHAPPSIREELLPAMGAGRRTREVITEACLRWKVPELVGPACTVATELVFNAVVHASTMMTLLVSLRGRYLHIAVRDGSTRPPVLDRDVDPAALRGRGLGLVDAMCRRWGSFPSDGGKVVWATLDLSPRS